MSRFNHPQLILDEAVRLNQILTLYSESLTQTETNALRFQRALLLVTAEGVIGNVAGADAEIAKATLIKVELLETRLGRLTGKHAGTRVINFIQGNDTLRLSDEWMSLLDRDNNLYHMGYYAMEKYRDSVKHYTTIVRMSQDIMGGDGDYYDEEDSIG